MSGRLTVLLSFAVVALVCALNLPAQSTPGQSPSSSVQAERLYKTGLAFVQERRLDEAIRSFELGLRLEPVNRVLLNAIGNTYSLKGDHRQAEAYLHRALHVDPGFVAARRNLAIEYFETGRYEPARQEFEKLMADRSAQPVANLFLGIISADQNQYEKAVTYLQKSRDLTFHYPQAILAWARALCELHQPEKTQSVLGHLEQLPGVSGPQYLEAGEICSRCGRYGKALEDFDRAQEMDPALPGVDHERADVLDKMGRSKEALKILEGITARKPDADSLNLLGHVAEETGDLNLAIQSFRRAAKIAPGQEDNYLDFSTLCLDYGNYPLALATADVGLANIPNSYRLMVQKGAILDKLGRRDEAEKVLRDAMRLQEDNSVALLSLAITESHDHRLQQAIETLESGLARFPKDYYMHYYLGDLLVQESKQRGSTPEMTEEAKRALERAIELNPAFADSYFQLAKLFLKTAPGTAEENLQKCLKLDPNHASAKYELGRLYLETGRQERGRKLLDQFIAQREAEELKQEQKPRIEMLQR